MWEGMAAAITTPSQLRTYLDKCQAWLVEQPEVVSDVKVTTMGWPVQNAHMRSTLGLCEDEIACITTFTCAICSDTKRDAHTICANPFARAQFALVCSTCIREDANQRGLRLAGSD